MNNTQFISNITSFDTDNLKPNVKDFVRKNFLQNKDWTIEAMYKASGAVGPLAEWLQS
jgi:hypothetical protein